MKPFSLTYVRYPEDDPLGLAMALASLAPFCMIWTTVGAFMARRELWDLLTLLGILLNEVLAQLLKRHFKEPRPAKCEQVDFCDTHGMPSSHAQLAAFVATMMTLQYVRRREEFRVFCKRNKRGASGRAGHADTMTAAMRVLRYLVSTKELGLRWTVGADTVLSGMSDSNWAVVKSTSGYVFFLAQAAIAYVSKKQASIAMSSTEAEIMAASLAALEAVFLRGLLSELDCLQESPTVLGVDNQGAIALAKNYVSNSRTKHIERRHLKIRELVEELAVRPEFVPTDGNVADILSKPLGRDKFEKFRRVLLNHEV